MIGHVKVCGRDDHTASCKEEGRTAARRICSDAATSLRILFQRIVEVSSEVPTKS